MRVGLAVSSATSRKTALHAIDGIAATSLFELLDDFRICATVAHGSAATSFDRLHGVDDFQRRLRLLAKETMARAAFRIEFPLNQLRRHCMRNAAAHTFVLDHIEPARRVAGMGLVLAGIHWREILRPALRCFMLPR